jgi:hypothetical protein
MKIFLSSRIPFVIPLDYYFIIQIITPIQYLDSAIAVSLFVMPVVYHHAQYPYTDVEKLKKRSHRFTMYGLIPAAVTLYLGLELGIELALRISKSYLLGDGTAFYSQQYPLLVFILYKKRK